MVERQVSQRVPVAGDALPVLLAEPPQLRLPRPPAPTRRGTAASGDGAAVRPLQPSRPDRITDDRLAMSADPADVRPADPRQLWLSTQPPTVQRCSVAPADLAGARSVKSL